MVLFQSSQTQSNPAKGYQCYNCQRYGHVSKDCRSKKVDGANSSIPRGTNSSIPFGTNSSIDLSGILSAGLQALNGNVLNANVDERGRSVWVTGIPEEFRDADFLCNVFGNYGNVQRIKFTQKKTDGALIELDDVRHASKAVRCLNGLNLGEEKISVKPTKIDRAKGKFDDEISKDFSKDRIGRYKKDSKFTAMCMKRASKPTSVILVSKLPKGKLAQLKKYIKTSGYTVKDTQEMKMREGEENSSSEYHPAIMIELESPEEAVNAVGKLHNTMPANIGEKKGSRGLAFSFTNKTDLKEKA
jgi:RNA recognition motif-containing protein